MRYSLVSFLLTLSAITVYLDKQTSLPGEIHQFSASVIFCHGIFRYIVIKTDLLLFPYDASSSIGRQRHLHTYKQRSLSYAIKDKIYLPNGKVFCLSTQTDYIRSVSKLSICIRLVENRRKFQ